jgi:hypothetical protein
MMVISILMIVFNVLRILGWIVLPISILALVLAKNYIQFSFYPEGMAVWKQNDTAHCQYVPYANIVEWTFQQNTNGVNTLILRTTDHQNVTADCLRSSAVSEVLNKRMPEKEALARANARAKSGRSRAQESPAGAQEKEITETDASPFSFAQRHGIIRSEEKEDFSWPMNSSI